MGVVPGLVINYAMRYGERGGADAGICDSPMRLIAWNIPKISSCVLGFFARGFSRKCLRKTEGQQLKGKIVS